MARKIREQFVSFSRSLEVSICRWPLGNKDTAEGNQCSRVEVVNLIDGWMDGWPYPLSHCKSTEERIEERKKKSPPMLPPPAPIMTVNFHPLLQNGCLMINRGSALRSRSHAASAHTHARVTVKRATPPSVLLRNAVLKRSLFS